MIDIITFIVCCLTIIICTPANTIVFLKNGKKIVTVRSAEEEPLGPIIKFASLFDLLDRDQLTESNIYNAMEGVVYQIGDKITSTAADDTVLFRDDSIVEITLLNAADFAAGKMYKEIAILDTAASYGVDEFDARGSASTEFLFRLLTAGKTIPDSLTRLLKITPFEQWEDQMEWAQKQNLGGQRRNIHIWT